jgi:hypothetical protein
MQFNPFKKRTRKLRKGILLYDLTEEMHMKLKMLAVAEGIPLHQLSMKLLKLGMKEYFKDKNESK